MRSILIGPALAIYRMDGWRVLTMAKCKLTIGEKSFNGLLSWDKYCNMSFINSDVLIVVNYLEL